MKQLIIFFSVYFSIPIAFTQKSNTNAIKVYIHKLAVDGRSFMTFNLQNPALQIPIHIGI